VLATVDLAGLAETRLMPSDEDAPGRNRLHADPRRLDNGIVSARFNDRGLLVALAVDGQDLDLSDAAGFTLHPDEPANFDAWDIDQFSIRLGEEAVEKIPLRVVERGPVRVMLRGRAALGDGSRLVVCYSLEAGSPWLQVEAKVEWAESHRLLKWQLRTGYGGRQARYGGPFGSIERGQLPGWPTDDAQWEVPGSRWAAVYDDAGENGVAVVTEAKYGFSCADGELGVSLLRSSTYPDPAADRGNHRLRWAVGAYRSQHHADRPSTAAAAETLFTPPVIAAGGSMLPPPVALDQLGSLIPAWITPAEKSDGLVLRLHETAGRRGSARLHVERSEATVTAINLLEEEQGSPEQLDAHTWRLDYKPYEILSILIS
jgi:alpha-mannosidase